MRRFGVWAVVLSVLLLATLVWAGNALARVDDEFAPQALLVGPEGPGAGQDPGDGSGGWQPGGGPGHSSVAPGQVESGGIRGWLADRGWGLLKGIGAGLIGAAAVGLGAVLLGASAPVLLAAAGAAVLGGAVYGVVVGGKNFNWTEAILGSVIGGVSAGVGSWLAAAKGALAAKIGIAVTDLVAGGLTTLSSYLVHSPDRSWGGALGAFALGSVTSGIFMGAGALFSRFWTWGKGVIRTVQEPQGAMVQAALVADAPPAPRVSPRPASAAPETVQTRVPQTNGISPLTFSFKAYLREIEAITGRTIPRSQRALLKEAIKKTRFTKVSREEQIRLRKEFTRLKKKLIEEWERNTGRPWPRYTEPVLSKEGRVLRQAGDSYDAHHIIELSLGGPNEWWNIHPAAFPDQHQGGIHRADGALRRVMDIVSSQSP